LTAIGKEIAEAQTEGKAKKVEKLQLKQQTVAARKDLVTKGVPPPGLNRLKRGEEIQKLRVKLLSLLALEDKGRSMSLTMVG
jgi:hypothetical protein